MTPHETPEETLQRLYACHSHERRRRSLRIVDAVCRGQKDHGSDDYTTRTIGRLSAREGGPGFAAMRNPAGAPYRELIDAHAKANPRLAKKEVADSDNENLVKGISSPLQRARIRNLAAEVSRLGAEMARARSLANHLQSIADASTAITLMPSLDAGTPNAASYGTHAKIELLDTERDALAMVLSDRWRSSVGLAADKRGRLVDSEGKKIMPVGFITMLQKVAAAIGVGPAQSSSVSVTGASH